MAGHAVQEHLEHPTQDAFFGFCQGDRLKYKNKTTVERHQRLLRYALGGILPLTVALHALKGAFPSGKGNQALRLRLKPRPVCSLACPSVHGREGTCVGRHAQITLGFPLTDKQEVGQGQKTSAKEHQKSKQGRSLARTRGVKTPQPCAWFRWQLE